MLTGHTFYNLYDVDQSTPIIFISVQLIFISILLLFFKETLEEAGFTQDGGEMCVDEDLPPFFKAVKNAEREWFLQEHYYFEANYRLSMVSDKTVVKLEASEYVKRPISGIHFYLPLCNPDYRSEFCYISPARGNRGSLLKSDKANDPHIYE